MPRSAVAGFVLAVTGLVLIVVLVTGCGAGSGAASQSVIPAASASPVAASPDGSGAAAASPAAASPTPSPGDAEVVVWLPEWANDDVPEQVAKRRPLPFCGIERAPAPQPGIFVDRAVRLCFWNAHLANAEAEFVSLQSTMEGAPIATIYRLAADGSVQVLTDFTQDPFGGGVWQLSNCARVVEGEGHELLGVADCVDAGPLE